MFTDIDLFQTPDLTPLDLCLWGWMKSEISKRKSGYTRRIARSHFGCCWPHKQKWKPTQDEQHAISATELRSALISSVGFSNICEL